MSTSTSGKPSPSPSPSSSGTSGPNAPSAAWNLPQLKLSTVLKIFAFLGVSVGIWYGIRGFYQDVVVDLSGYYLTWFDGAPPAENIYFWDQKEGKYKLETGLYYDPVLGKYLTEDQVTSNQQVPYQISLVTHEVTWNLILFLTLIFLIPFEKIKRRWWWGVISAAILYNVHSLIIAYNVFYSLAWEYLNKMGFVIADPEMVQFLGKVVQGHAIVGAPVIPILLLFPMFLKIKEKKAKATPQVEDTKVRPNSPCPCGSGKKFKKCCGA